MERKCDNCERPLNPDKVWILPAYIYIACSPGCLAFLHLNPRSTTLAKATEE